MTTCLCLGCFSKMTYIDLILHSPLELTSSHFTKSHVCITDHFFLMSINDVSGTDLCYLILHNTSILHVIPVRNFSIFADSVKFIMNNITYTLFSPSLAN